MNTGSRVDTHMHAHEEGHFRYSEFTNTRRQIETPPYPSPRHRPGSRALSAYDAMHSMVARARARRPDPSALHELAVRQGSV